MTNPPHLPSPPLEELIGPYLAGELDAATARRVQAYLDAHDGRRGFLAGLRASARSEQLGAHPSIEASRTAFLAKVTAHELSVDRSVKRSVKRPRHATPATRRAHASWVAAALLAIGVFGVWALITHRGHRSRTATTYATRTAQRATVTLIDGTRVTLAPESRLAVANDFADGNRMVTLTGEADFTVPIAHGAPFIVNTGAISTRVLGTAFSVRRYTLAEPMQVAVRSGKVVAAGRNRQITVTAGTMAQVTDSTATAMGVSDLHSYTDWSANQLIFEKERVPVMLETVGRWYGYEFRLMDSTLATRRVSGVFKLSDPTDMMVALRAVLDVTMSFQGTVVTLTPRRDAQETYSAPTHTPVRTDVMKPSMEIGR